jgi:hypothetical protein
MKYNQLINSTFLVLYFVLMMIAYNQFIADVWAYYGFKSELDISIFVVSLVTLILCGILIKTNLEGFFLYIYLIIYFIPAQVLISNGNGEYNLFFVQTLFLAALICALRVRFPIVVNGYSSQKVLHVILALTIVLAAVYLITFKGSFNLNVLAVYDFRSENAQASFIPSQVIALLTKLLIPLAAVYFLSQKNYLILFVCVILNILVFAAYQHKAVLINPLISIIIYYLLTNTNSPIKSLLSLSVIGVLTLLFLSYFYHDLTKFIASFGLRRFIFLPALIETFVFDYFSNGKFALWSHSGITFGLVDKQYDISLPFIIGKEYFGSPDMYANFGMLASGFANGGFFGVIVYAISFIVLTKLILSYSGVNRIIVASVTLPFLLSILRSNDLLVGLNTNGLAVFIALLYFSRSKNGNVNG